MFITSEASGVQNSTAIKFVDIPFYFRSAQVQSANSAMGKEGYDHIQRHVEGFEPLVVVVIRLID
jgi:hypothetical protein